MIVSSPLITNSAADWLLVQVREVELLLYSAARCSVIYPAPSDVIERHVTMATFICQYVVPMLVTSLAYGRIACRLWWPAHDIARASGYLILIL